MSKKGDKKDENPLADMGFDEALSRLSRVKPGELAEAMTRDLMADVEQTRERIREAREDIERGARTKGKKRRFRL